MIFHPKSHRTKSNRHPVLTLTFLAATTLSSMAMDNEDSVSQIPQITAPPSISTETPTSDTTLFLELKQKADAGDAQAQFNLGELYSRGSGVECSDTMAFTCYKLAADQGHAKAQYSVSMGYNGGLGTNKSFEEGFKYLKLSADQGYTNAQKDLGKIYLHGENNVGQNHIEAFKYYKLAADQGDIEAQLAISQMYEKGIGVEQNSSESTKYLHAYIRLLVKLPPEELEEFIRISSRLFKDLQDDEIYNLIYILSALKDIPADLREIIVISALPYIKNVTDGYDRSLILRHIAQTLTQEYTAPTKQFCAPIPTPGTDAFWAQSPQNPTQKILLVPSLHSLNFKDVRPDLGKAIKASQVLIVENLADRNVNSWSDEEMINARREMKGLNEDLIKNDLVRTEPFLYGGESWMKYLTASSQNYLTHNFEITLNSLLELFKKKDKDHFPPILSRFPLDNIDPAFIMNILFSIVSDKKRNLGMDTHITKHFCLDDKKYKYGLETIKEVNNLIIPEDSNPLGMTEKHNFITVAKCIEKLIAQIEEQNIKTPKQIREENQYLLSERIVTSRYDTPDSREDVYKRNLMWMPRLLEHFNAHKDDSIVVVVGASHFPDKFGILNLLSEQGFTFTKF